MTFDELKEQVEHGPPLHFPVASYSVGAFVDVVLKFDRRKKEVFATAYYKGLWGDAQVNEQSLRAVWDGPGFRDLMIVLIKETNFAEPT